jgi:hypothetical protein
MSMSINGIKKFLASLVPQSIKDVLVYEAIQKDRQQAEDAQAKASSIREELLKGYHEDVEANRRLTMCIFAFIDPHGSIQKQERFERFTHIQDTAIAYLKYFKQRVDDLEATGKKNDTSA